MEQDIALMDQTRRKALVVMVALVVVLRLMLEVLMVVMA